MVKNHVVVSHEMSAFGDLAHLLPPSWQSVITAWLAEDTPSFDYGGFVVGEAESEAFLFCKSSVGCFVIVCHDPSDVGSRE